MEDLVGEFFGVAVVGPKVVECVKPLVARVVKVEFDVLEFGHLHVDKGELVVEYVVVVNV